MSSYKEKIQKQLKKTLQGFRNTQSRSLKTQLIQKQFKKRKVLRSRSNYYQHVLGHHPQETAQTLNFYNILTVNEKALMNEHHCVSYLQTNFFSKSIKKVELKENYVVISLNDSTYIQPPVQETLARYKSSENQKIRTIGFLLSDLARKMEMNAITQDTSISLTAQTFQMLDALGDVPFVCKIFSQKIVISKSLLELKEMDSEDFILQSLKAKLPLLEVLTTKHYFDLVKKQIEFYSGLMDVLRGSIPFSTFLGISCMHFDDTITSKNNVQNICQMSLSMPIPLVELIKVQKILETRYNQSNKTDELFGQKMKRYQQRYRARQHEVLQHLVLLQKNCIPESYTKVASYMETSVEWRSDDEERKSVGGSDFDKNSLTWFQS